MLSERPYVEAGGGRQAASRPWWLGAGVVALGCICLYGALGLSQSARYAAIGPGLFVTIAGAGLILLGLILLVQIARDEIVVARESDDASDADAADVPALMTALAAVTLPIVTIEALGLPITAMLSFALVARSFGSRKTIADIIAGALLGALAWLLFTRLGLQLGGFLPIAGL